MTAENSCGEPEYWDGKTPKESDEVKELKREILQRKVLEQQGQLLELEERHYRDTHPGLKELWDQYQTMLTLVKKDHK